MRQILLKTPRGNTAVIPVDHFVSKANESLSCEQQIASSKSYASQADEDTAAIAAAVDTTRIFEETDVDREGKEQLLYELIGASKRRDVGRKRNARSLYTDDDRMDIDDCDGNCACGSEEQKVATKFGGIDINSDDSSTYDNIPKSRRRFSTNCGIRSSMMRNVVRQEYHFPQQQQQQQQQQHSGRHVFPGSPTCSSSRPPLMVAFYHEGRRVTLDRIWEWITGSSKKSEINVSNSARAAAASSSSSSDSSFPEFPLYLTLSPSVRLLGGIDRQNRVGSKFGGGGVSSSQNAERERKERLKQLALESIDLAKDPYLMRNHLGTYECKLCLTLHTNEANYLAHTQGKKHQAGLAKRAHMEKLRKEREEQLNERNNLKRPPQYDDRQQARKTIKIGRPAYQVFKSRDTDTQQRCLTFELTYKDIKEGLRPRHRFMSAFEQRVDLPRDKRYQYVLFAAEPYETIAFKIPNDPLDRDPGRLITHWDEDDKKFTVTLYFADNKNDDEAKLETKGTGVMSTFAPALGSR